jgi:hypothetical protein
VATEKKVLRELGVFRRSELDTLYMTSTKSWLSRLQGKSIAEKVCKEDLQYRTTRPPDRIETDASSC